MEAKEATPRPPAPLLLPLADGSFVHCVREWGRQNQKNKPGELADSGGNDAPGPSP